MRAITRPVKITSSRFELEFSANDRIGGLDRFRRFFLHCGAFALPAVSEANGFESEVVSQKQDKGTRHSGGH